MSKAEVSRVERGKAPWLAIDELCQIASAVGLDVSVRLYPGGPAVRDRAQLPLLGRLHAELHASLGWRVEVPVPLGGNGRAWDAMIIGRGWRLAVEAETRLHDLQAVERRIALKQRDDGDIPVLLLVNDTRHNRDALVVGRASLRALLPLDARTMLTALRNGSDPGGSGIVFR